MAAFGREGLIFLLEQPHEFQIQNVSRRFSQNTSLLTFRYKLFIFVETVAAYSVYSFFFIYFADRASQYIYLNINQLDALNFIKSLFHASTCFEHMCLSSGGQNCTM